MEPERFEISRDELRELIDQAVRNAAPAIIREVTRMKPLMNEDDVLHTLGVGRTTFSQKIQPKLPPLWIEGQKRWHPDAVDAYIRSLSRKKK